MNIRVINLLGVAALWPLAVSGTVMVYSDSLPETLTPACSAALLKDIACNPLVRNLRPEWFYPPESLSRVCTEGCTEALSQWMSSVRADCGNQMVAADFDLEASAVIIPGSLSYLFQFSCLQESGRYCGPVAALAAAFVDPGVSEFNYISEAPADAVRPSDCDTCLAERLRIRAGSPYFDGPIVASESVYESMSSSCGITGKPVSTTTIDYFTAEPQPTEIVCDGDTYNIQAPDDCNSIARSQGVGTAWLLADNQLNAYCANFPSSGELCITNKCATVTVGTNATCAGIAAAANITDTQLHAWNPIINMACSNLVSMNGTELCVDAPGRKFVPPTGTVPPLTPTVPAPIPTDTAIGSDKACAKWYEVQPGDFCNALTLKFSISLVNFLFLNTGVNENCTNLFADESYCVQPVGDRRPGYMPITIDPSASFTGVPFTELPEATGVPYSRYTPLPTATGTRDDCVHYFDGGDFQDDVSGSYWDNNCVLAAYIYNVELADFALWNPGIGNVSESSCAFEPGVRYCGSWYLQKPVETESVPTLTTTTEEETGTSMPQPPAETHPRQPANCNEWAVNDGTVDCGTLAANAGISKSQFLEWNPAVSQDCTQNYWVGYAYCVGLSDPPTPTEIETTGVTEQPPGPTKPPAEYVQSGQPENCIAWDRAVEGDWCGKLAERNGLTVSQLAELNPALGQDGKDCGTMIWLDYYYCVATS